MVDDLGWSRGSITLAITGFLVISAIVLPVYGRLIDRYNLRDILALSVIISGIGLGLVTFVQEPWQFMVCYGLIFAIGHAGFSISTVSVMVTRSFPDKPGIANSIAISGNGVGQLVVVAFLTSTIVTMGWRFSYIFLSVAMVGFLLPLIITIIRSTPFENEVNLREIQKGVKLDSFGSEAKSREWESFRRLPLSRELGLLSVLYVTCGFQDFFIATHITSFAIDNTVSVTFAGNLFALMGLMSLFGAIGSGLMADRYGPSAPTHLCFIIRVIIFSLVIVSPYPLTIGVLALLYGFTFLITAPLTVVFIREKFGSSRLGTLLGGINMSHQIGGAIGAYAGGVIFDVTGSYNLMMFVMVCLSLVGTLVTVLLREKPILARER